MDFNADVEVFGGVSTLAVTPGVRIGVDLGLDIPLGFRQELQARIGYDHDSFGLKTFNFLPEETGAGDIRLIQSTDDVSGKISWIAGSRRSVYSRFTVSGGAGRADDPEDTYITVKADESIDFRLNRYMKTGMDADIRWKTFPQYLVNNRKLDYIQGTISPYLQVYPSSNLNLKTSYRFEIKQYLDAKYESSPGVPAEKNRRYIVNSAGVSIDAKMGPVFRPSLGYIFTYNKSNNYNITVSGLPADIFIEGYYDYYEDDIKVQTDFRWSRRFRTDIDGSVSFRNFITYPVRDETKTFIGEIRKDTEIKINGSVEYMFQPEKKNRVADLGIVIDTGYVNSISNMTYEKSFDTNHEYATFLLGLHLELP